MTQCSLWFEYARLCCALQVHCSRVYVCMYAYKYVLCIISLNESFFWILVLYAFYTANNVYLDYILFTSVVTSSEAQVLTLKAKAMSWNCLLVVRFVVNMNTCTMRDLCECNSLLYIRQLERCVCPLTRIRNMTKQLGFGLRTSLTAKTTVNMNMTIKLCPFSSELLQRGRI